MGRWEVRETGILVPLLYDLTTRPLTGLERRFHRFPLRCLSVFSFVLFCFCFLVSSLFLYVYLCGLLQTKFIYMSLVFSAFLSSLCFLSPRIWMAGTSSNSFSCWMCEVCALRSSSGWWWRLVLKYLQLSPRRRGGSYWTGSEGFEERKQNSMACIYCIKDNTLYILTALLHNSIDPQGRQRESVQENRMRQTFGSWVGPPFSRNGKQLNVHSSGSPPIDARRI